MTIYVAKDGNRLQAAEWQRLSFDSSYSNEREFDNGRVRVVLLWTGKVSTQLAQTLSEYWPVFTLSVQNYNASGALIPDPNADGRTFPDLATALAGYENFLVEWGACEYDEEGKFVEVDNALTPPPPPDPDAPTSVIPSLPSDFSAW